MFQLGIVTFDHTRTQPIDSLVYLPRLDPKIANIKLLEGMKAIASVRYPPRLSMYEVSSVESKDFVHKCRFDIFTPMYYNVVIVWLICQV